MTAETTNHLGINLLYSSQSQKEVTVNEALARIDAILNTGVIDKDLATPPGSPSAGDVYIVAASPTGSWAGKAGHIAYFDQIWRFITPREGLTLWVNDENLHYAYNGTSWNLSGGAIVYEEGTFTPTLYGSTVAGITTYSSQTGEYTRIGGMVFCRLAIVWSNTTGTGEARIGGLPFTCHANVTNRGVFVVAYYNGIVLPAGKVLGGFVNAGTTYIRLCNLDNTTANDLTDMTEMTVNGDLYITVVYKIA